jgi:hypothetical protein
VVGTFARVFERKRKVETLSPSCRASSVGFDEETEVKTVTESDRTLASGSPACLVSSGRGVCSERTLAAVHRRVRCIFARQRTQATGHSASASGANDISTWRGRVITERWGASDHPLADASGACFPSLEPYWSRPDAGSVASGVNERHVQCGVYANAVKF